MTAPTFTIVETTAVTLGVWSDGRVCRVAFDPDTDRMTFHPIGVCDRAALWPTAYPFRATDGLADTLLPPPARAD